MQRLVGWLFVGWLTLTGARAAMIFFDDAQVSADVGNVPSTLADNENHAASIAATARERAEQRKCKVLEDGVEVTVREPIAQSGPLVKFTQQIDTHVRCLRRNAVFRMTVLDVKTSVVLPVGGGHANSWPVAQ